MTTRTETTAQLNRLGKWSTTHATSFLEEFRNFALKGNVVDLAIGVIIGAAFGKIVDSLVKNIIMPLVSLAIPSKDSFLGWKIVVAGKEVPYGLFLSDVVTFLIVALALFLFVVKFLGWVARRRTATEADVPTAVPSRQEELLAEIRDLLKERPHAT